SASTTRRGGGAGEATGDAATSGAAATGAMAGGLAADSNLATSAGRLGWAAVPGGATASGTASGGGGRRMTVGPSSFSCSSTFGGGGALFALFAGATAGGSTSGVVVRRMMVGPSSFSSSSSTGSGGGRAAPFFFFPDSFFCAASFAADLGEGTVTGRAGSSCRCSAPHAGQRATSPPRSTRRSTNPTTPPQERQRSFIGGRRLARSSRRAGRLFSLEEHDESRGVRRLAREGNKALPRRGWPRTTTHVQRPGAPRET